MDRNGINGKNWKGFGTPLLEELKAKEREMEQRNRKIPKFL